MNGKLVRIDGIKWHDLQEGQSHVLRVKYLEALCPTHSLRLTPSGGLYGNTYHCAEGGSGHTLTVPRSYPQQRKYVVDKMDALLFSEMSVINLDDEAIPVASESLKDTDYWVKAKVTESKSGTRLIVWAGSKKAKNKAQLFVEPELKRLSFDQNDDHPTEVFAKVEATFVDEVKGSIKQG